MHLGAETAKPYPQPSRRSPAVIGAVLSLIFMGLGQLYHRQFVKGILLMLLEVYLFVFWTLPFRWAMWGLTTLGETPQKQVGFEVTRGDHSIFLLIEGIIFFILFCLFLWIYYLTVKDAYKVGRLREAGVTPNSFSQTWRHVMEYGFPYILLTPALLFTAFLTVLPLIFGVLIAFTNYSAPNYLPPKALVDWVGLDTFISLFSMNTWSSTFYGVFSWTIIWAVLATVTTFMAGLILAVFINRQGIRFKGVWKGIFILPWAIPQLVSILIMRNLFNGEFGPINQYLELIGLGAIPWLSDPMWAKTTLIMVNLWFGFPFWMVLMSGVMTSIDKELYEASSIDGATEGQKFRKITLPLIMFSTAPLLIMNFASNFNNFNIIYLMTEGNPVNVDYSYAGSTDILISWIYKMTLDQSQFAMASVVSILIFLIVGGISLWNFRRTKAFKEEDMLS
ncbi:ABC transporter permease subunit [Bacillus mangrovi]|uniref:Maltose/maltodextrin transport system permease protein n=1 Tax=Metabacillus mangrovi TaxID=1491830 RepID=A0A7X2S5Y6_9BACI|nr:sugar ABC transporter permease [Metabacillus mangrovi]MTH54279.1 ABC transporter permease subunit [Metabacillus mangrovi]